MSNLFIRHFSKVLATHLKVNIFETNPKNLKTALSTFRAKYDLKDYTILHRLPRKDLKTLSSLSCPITRNQENKENNESLIPETQVIASMKNLRYALNILESRTCYKCPFNDTCKFRDQVPEGHKANVTDLLTALIALAGKDQAAFKKIAEEFVEKKKTDTDKQKTEEVLNKDSVPPQTEEKKAQEQQETPASNLNLEQNAAETESKQENLKDKQQDNAEGEATENNSNEELKFKYYNSGLNVIDSLSVILEDLYQNDGLESKRFINTFLEELSKSKRQSKESAAAFEKQNKAEKTKKKEKITKPKEEEASSGSEEEEKEEGSSEDYDLPRHKKEFQKKKMNYEDFQDNNRGNYKGKFQRENFNRKNFRNRSEENDQEEEFSRPYSKRFSQEKANYEWKSDKFNRKYSHDNNESQGFRGNRRNFQRGNQDRDERFPKWNQNDDFRGKKSNRFQRYDVEDNQRGSYKRDFNRQNKKEYIPNEEKREFFEEEDQIKTDKFMRDSKREFKKQNFDEKPMKFRKRPQDSEFPVIEKEDMLVRNKAERKKNDKNSNFSFTETDPKNKEK